MRHLNVGRKLGVDQSHRIALLRGLTLSLIEQDGIRTTPARAKELRWYADRVITLAKRGDIASRRQIVQLLGSTKTYSSGENRVRTAVEKVYTLLVPRFQGRNGGYTQIIRLADRRPGDNAEVCYMRYLPAPEEAKEKKKDGKGKEAKAKGTSKKKAASADAEAATKHAKAEKAPKTEKSDKKETKSKKKEKED
jgi:large subunit ribosomal protein L17